MHIGWHKMLTFRIIIFFLLNHGPSISLFKGNVILLKICCYITVPILRALLPNDVCKISKHRSTIRIDTTLIALGDDMRWKRGDITLLINFEAPYKEAFTLMNNEKRQYQILRFDVSKFITQFALVSKLTLAY